MKTKNTIITVLITVIVTTLIIVGAFFVITRNSNDNDDTPSEGSTIVDMNSDEETEYGRIYYSAPSENNIDEENGIKYINNEILITTKDGISREEVEMLAEKYNCEIVGEIEITGDYQLRLTSEMDYEQITGLIEQFEAEEIVDFATLNHVHELYESANDGIGDFYYGKKWKSSLKDNDDGEGKSWGYEVINTPDAWQQLIDHDERINPVKVGLIDSGFDVSHDDLGFAQVFYDGGANGVTTREQAHGSHVAGTMAAKANDKTGICGIYPYGDGRLYATAMGYESGASSYNVLDIALKICLAELIVRNVKVINVSMDFRMNSYPNFSEWYMETAETNAYFRDAKRISDVTAEFLQRMIDKGYDFVIVSIAGNDSSNIPTVFDASKANGFNYISRTDYPEVYDRIIVVGAVDYNLEIASYSNGGNRVDIYAPGGEYADNNEMIYSCLADNSYGYMEGTSMAAPHVSGVAAMVWSANNGLTGDQVKDIIRSSVSSRCASCNMIDANLAVRTALRIPDTGSDNNAYNCGVLGYVVDEVIESIAVEGATVTATNTRTGEEYQETTDEDGHFELMVPAGTYTITVEAEGYLDYTWPGNNTEYSDTITVRNEQIKYLDDWIKMSRAVDFTEPSTEERTTLNINNSTAGEFFDYLEDYGLPLEDAMVWGEYNGHMYVLYDYYMSSIMIDSITEVAPEVHLVTITDEDEQKFVEDLVAEGGRNIYYTGGRVNDNGNLYWVTGENASYDNWCEGCPEEYGQEGYIDTVVIYRGEDTKAQDDSDFGLWFEVLEDEYSFYDIFDTDIEGITRGIIMEFDEY